MGKHNTSIATYTKYPWLFMILKEAVYSSKKNISICIGILMLICIELIIQNLQSTFE